MMYRTGEHAKALEFYERALEIDPRDQDAIKARKNLAAETALTQGRYDSVGHSREQIKDKDEARSLERGQRIHKSEEELREELERLEVRLAESSSDPELLTEVGELYRKLGDLEAALEFIERAMEYRRDSYDLAKSHGALKAKVLKKRIAKADKLEDSEKANKTEAELKDFELELAGRLLAFRPGDAELRLNLAKRLLRAGDYDTAIGELQKVSSDPRAEREARFLLGQAFHAKGFGDLAKKEFLLAIEDDARPDERTKEILYNLAAITEAAGEAEEARSYYSRIFEVDISYRDVAQKMEGFK
jgi:tetratricopeptide (TPR) repeat protein